MFPPTKIKVQKKITYKKRLSFKFICAVNVHVSEMYISVLFLSFFSQIRIHPNHIYCFFQTSLPCYFWIPFLALDIGGSRALSRCIWGVAASAPLIIGQGVSWPWKKGQQILFKENWHMHTCKHTPSGFTVHKTETQLACSSLSRLPELLKQLPS